MVKQLIILVFVLLGFNGLAQITHGGQPVSTASPLAVMELLPLAAPVAAVQSTLTSEQGKLPLRFAEPIYTSFTPQNSGVWEQQGKMYVWRLALRSEGAKSLNVIFDRFYLEHGDRLFAYNPSKTHVLGGFTNENNNPSKLFAIAPIIGDEIILELQTPRPPDASHELLVSAVNHDYLGVVEYIKGTAAFGDSDDCHVNAICGPLNSSEINRSVCKVIIDGSALCSGTLMNNTSQNGKPYFLTAAHCFDQFDISSGSITAQNIIFYFNFDSPNCETTAPGRVDQTISGADVKAFVKNVDLALLEMNKMPPTDYQPYWAGWSRETVIADKVFSVHHPQGDVKKVSVSASAPVATTFSFFGRFIDDAHWHVAEWESGTTEGGSSGSGLFTQEQLLIGSLSGGYATCGNPVDDYYMRLNKAWDVNAATDKQLVFWLDNVGEDVLKLEGIDFYTNKKVLTHYHVSDEKVVKYDNAFKGSWSGHNSRGDDAFAELYDDIPASKIAGVFLSPAKVTNNYPGQTFNIKIWNALNGLPNEEIGSIDGVSLSSMSGARQLFTLETPLEVNEPIFVGVELNYSPVPIDTLAIYQFQPADGLPARNKAYIRNSGLWQPYSALHPDGANGAYLIELLVDSNYLPTDSGDLERKDKVRLHNNPVRNSRVAFSSDIPDLTTVKMYGLNGRLVKTYAVQNASEDNFSVAEFPAGIYLLKFSSPTESVVKKLMLLD
ncbi:trypsin-like peptidase domain-containing protein [Carboxylicivirga taeanensis]|uniref:trypsin-like peptidase domain-containing protein n=1 Tax=Carboxylicivirga taeanensis TaxID=1416875 RepID=UPI003F6DE308